MISIDYLRGTRWHQKLKEYNDAFGRNMVDTERTELRLLLQRIMTGYTDSPTLGGKGRGVATPPMTKAQGEAAVRKDILKTMLATPVDMVKKPRAADALRRLEAQGNDRAVAKVLIDLGWNIKPSDVQPFNPHIHARWRRNGTVPRSAQRVIVVPGSRIEPYIASRQKMVGQAKGGWASAITALGGSVPVWVARHAAAGESSESYSSSQSEVVWSLNSDNNSAWASGVDTPGVNRIVDQAMAARTAALTAKIDREMAELNRP